MRKIIFSFVFILLSVSQAQKLTSEIQKESYLPKQGKIIALPSLTAIGSKQSIKGPLGTVADYKNSTSTFDYVIGYALSDRFTLGLSGHIYISDQSDYEYGVGSTLNGTSETLKSAGIQEPEIMTKYRLLDNEATKLRINLLFGLATKLQKAKYATVTSDGNEGIGATNFRLGFEFYKEITNLEFVFILQRNFYGMQETESAAKSSASNERSAYQTSVVSAGVVASLSENMSFGGQLKLGLVDSRNLDTLANGRATSTLQYDASTTSYLTLLGKCKFNEESNLQLNLQSLLSTSQTAKIGASKLSYSDVSATQLQLGWLQSF